MELMPDTTTTRCPYCGDVRNYVYRVIEIGGFNPYSERIKAIEICCVNCHRTLSVTPINR